LGVRINIGCGQTPTPGWVNYDNSWSVKVAHAPLAYRILRRTGISAQQREFIEFARKSDILWADACAIPEPDGSAEVIYASHMFEHLDRHDAAAFLSEARRVLRPGGVLRLAVPDIRYHLGRYTEHRDADLLVRDLMLSRMRPRTVLRKLAALAVGERHHQWMYDGPSLCRLLAAHGFVDPVELPAGETRITEPGPLNLAELAPESVFVEARNPGA
jgi:SAM-dependent methyltransferase